MSSINVLLKKNKQTSTGQFPLYLRIIKDRKTKFISLGIKLEESQWDQKTQKAKKNHPNSNRVNAFIAKKIAEAEAETLDMAIEGRTLSTDSFIEVKGKEKTDFFSFAEKYVDSFKNKGKIGSYKRTKYTIEKLKEYHGNQKLQFKEITVAFLKNYEAYLSGTLNNKINTIQANFKVIRTILNNAVNEDIIKRDKNPFYKFKIQSEPTNRSYLTEQELANMDNLDLVEDSNLFHHRNMYVFSSYVGGLRVSDILTLKWENFDGSHITIKILKTGSTVSIKVPQRGLEILTYYKEKTFKNKNGVESASNFVFPILSDDYYSLSPTLAHNALSSATAYINKNLKEIAKMAKIEKTISYHTSRNTFGTRALRKGMRIEYVSKLMGHATIKETQVYAKIVNEELDKAMDVFN
jgi:site-specific recombinase XerD